MNTSFASLKVTRTGREDALLVYEGHGSQVFATLLAALAAEIPGYRFAVAGKEATSRTYAAFAEFAAVAILPHDPILLAFDEFYSMFMPTFLPAGLSKYQP